MENERIFCNDVDCAFKVKNKGATNPPGSCEFQLIDAISFFEQYKITLCEVGMGDVDVSEIEGVVSKNNDTFIQVVKQRWKSGG